MTNLASSLSPHSRSVASRLMAFVFATTVTGVAILSPAPALALDQCPTGGDCVGGARFLAVRYLGPEPDVEVSVANAADPGDVLAVYTGVEPGQFLYVDMAQSVLPIPVSEVVFTVTQLPLPLEVSLFHVSCSQPLTQGQSISARLELTCFDSAGVDADDACALDCDGGLGCSASPELCGDGLDNNGDGRVDCADPECDGAPECPLPGCSSSTACEGGVRFLSVLYDGPETNVTISVVNAADTSDVAATFVGVNPGDVLNLGSSGDGAALLPLDLTFVVVRDGLPLPLEVFDLHISCSQPLTPGQDISGRMQLLCFDSVDIAEDDVCRGNCTGLLCVPTFPSCSSDLDCDDGLTCNGAETCDPLNGCVAGTPLSCDDGVFCNGEEICTEGSGCQAGPPVVCDDGVECTADFCDPDTDSCTIRPRNLRCSDGLYCNGRETCDPIRGCLPALEPVLCEDDVTCTVDSCNEITDRCDHVPTNSLCSDGQFCNGEEICDSRRDCQPAQAPIDCSGLSTQCSAGVCDELLDSCAAVAVNEASPCDDGIFCTGSSECSAGTCVATGGTCGDGILQAVCGEECDNPADPNCTAGCAALAGACGNGILEGTETCELPSAEICDDRADNDGDGLVDCADPDCTGGSQIDPSPSCGATCVEVPACKPILDDPAIIRIHPDPRRSLFKFHGRVLAAPEDFDPMEQGFGLVVSNEDGVIFRAELLPGDFTCRKLRCKFKDRLARSGAGRRDGIYTLRTRFKQLDGEWTYTFTVKVFTDLSRATTPRMTTQVYGVDGVGFLTSDWRAKGEGWILRLKDAIQVEY